MTPAEADATSHGSSPAPLDSWAAAPDHRRAFLVTQHGPQPREAELESVDRALAMACIRLSAVGTPATLLATSYLPGQQRWIGLVVAESEAAVRLAASNAQLRNAHVTEV